MGKKEGARLDKKCRIHVHSRRRRLADPGGISFKALIDGLVLAGVLPDDNAKFIKEPTASQEVAENDETIVDVVWEL